MKKLSTILCTLALLFIGVGGVKAEKRDLSFSCGDHCAASWNTESRTFSWGSGGWNPAWTFMTVTGLSGDLSSYTKMVFKLEDFDNVVNQKLTLYFKENQGDTHSMDYVAKAELIPDANGIVELDLTTFDWKNEKTPSETINKKNIVDVTIYGGERSDNEKDGSVKVSMAFIYKPACLTFNALGVANIDLLDLEFSEGLTYDSTTGILTSETEDGDLYLIFNDEDFSNVTRIEVETTVSGAETISETEYTYTDIINTLSVYDAVSNNSLNTWYNSKYGVSDFANYSPGRVNKIKWHIDKAGTMKFSGVTVTGRVVNGAAPGWDNVSTAMYNTDAVLHLNQDATCVYGKQDSFTADDYADISAYKKLKLTGVAGTTVRVYINSATAEYYTLDSEGNLIIDFESDNKYKDAASLHLMNIRASAYNTTANISSVQLYHDDYVLNGSGRILASAQTILYNEALTSINATGITAATDLTTANPNCLIVANDGMVTNTQNVIVSGACAQLALTDGYPFKSPVAFTATAAPTYSRAFTASTTTTVCLPFALTAAEASSLGTFYELSSFDGSTLNFTSVDAPEANTPYLVMPTATALTMSETDKSIVVTPASLGTGATIENIEFIGTLDATTIPASDVDYSYFAYNNGGLVKITTKAATLPAFRGYFKVTTSAISGARSLNISFDDETTGVKTINRESFAVDQYYDLQGRRVAQPTKGLYIVNGKKVIK